MKYRELHRIIRKNGWVLIPARGKGSHKRYTKDGAIHTVPDHGSKEIDNNLAKQILNDMGIKR